MQYLLNLAVRRWPTLKAIYHRRWGAIAILGILLSGIGLWLDWMPSKYHPPALPELAGWLPWYGWTIVALVVVLLFMFEGAHREITRLTRVPHIDVDVPGGKAKHVYTADCDIEEEGVYVLVPGISLYNYDPEQEVVMEMQFHPLVGGVTPWLPVEGRSLESVRYLLNRDDDQGAQLQRPLVLKQRQTVLGWAGFFVRPDLMSAVGGREMNLTERCSLRLTARDTGRVIAELDLQIVPLTEKRPASSSAAESQAVRDTAFG